MSVQLRDNADATPADGPGRLRTTSTGEEHASQGRSLTRVASGEETVGSNPAPDS